ncbi:MAG: trigger factor, partial [Nostocoides sp.]
MDPNEFATTIDQQGQIPSIVQEVGRRKALASVLEQATVTDTDGNPVDLNQSVAVSDPEADEAAADEDAAADAAVEESASVQA